MHLRSAKNGTDCKDQPTYIKKDWMSHTHTWLSSYWLEHLTLISPIDELSITQISNKYVLVSHNKYIKTELSLSTFKTWKSSPAWDHIKSKIHKILNALQTF